jgi:AcrR family transcriptional regulator
MNPRRTRRTPDEARRLILEAAERKLAEGGPEAVRVQRIAAELGITDAAIYHHFASREGLLDALVRFGARRLRGAMEELLARADGKEIDIAAITALALDTFEKKGYARLALWMSMSGSKAERGSGMFDSLGVAFERIYLASAPAGADTARATREARFLAALLVLVIVAEPLMGTISRRSVGLGPTRSTTNQFRTWFADAMALLLAHGEKSRADAQKR